MDNDNTSPTHWLRVLKPVVRGVCIGIVAIYAAKHWPGNGSRLDSPQNLPAAETLNATGEASGASVAAFVPKAVPEPLPAVSFQDAGGQTVTPEAWRGKVVLLNLWATWCIPCRKEMPALDRLQAALGSADFEVVALSIDRSGAAGTRKFLDSTGIKNLKLYVDPTAKLATEFKALGLPTTLLIDRQGREIGRLTGPAEWDSAEGKALIGKALAGK